MRSSTELSAGMICETLGFNEKYDGGGAKYIIEARSITDTDGNTVSTEANDMDIIAIGGESYTLVARFLYEGKPVNVLQFGAINTYTTYMQGTNPYQVDEDDVSPNTRNDQPAIQRAIDYTHDKLVEYDPVKIYAMENKILVIRDEDCYKNAINTIIIPEGNYVIKTQLQIPPYMRFYLTGDVQFLSKIIPFSANDITTYKLEGTDTSNYSLTSIEKYNQGILPNQIPDAVPEGKEIFTKNDFYYGDAKLNLSSSGKDEYYVYKHGTVKICYKFDNNGNPINPYKTKANDRYAVSPSIYNEIFCGPGSLTINNISKIAVSDGEKFIAPYYSCAIEIGSTEENIRYFAKNSQIKNIGLSYENLRFKKLKIRGFHIGMLQHGYSFYSNVISDTEFRENDIAFQFGVYGEEESIGLNYIIKEIAIKCAEMNHFRDCLFSGNKVSVNILLSGLSATFTSCHFDFENCVFRTAYRTNLTVDKCHIEGTGRRLKENISLMVL